MQAMYTFKTMTVVHRGLKIIILAIKRCESDTDYYCSGLHSNTAFLWLARITVDRILIYDIYILQNLKKESELVISRSRQQ